MVLIFIHVAIEQEGAGGDTISGGAVSCPGFVHQGVHCNGEHDSHWRRRRTGTYVELWLDCVLTVLEYTAMLL